MAQIIFVRLSVIVSEICKQLFFYIWFLSTEVGQSLGFVYVHIVFCFTCDLNR